MSTGRIWLLAPGTAAIISEMCQATTIAGGKLQSMNHVLNFLTGASSCLREDFKPAYRVARIAVLATALVLPPGLTCPPFPTHK